MIQPTVLSPTAAPAPGIPASSEMLEGAEIEAQFAALLGLHLNADVVAEGAPARQGAVVPPQSGKAAGKSSPDEMPLTVDANMPDDGREIPVALMIVMPVVPGGAVAEPPAPMRDRPAQRGATTLPQSAAPVLNEAAPVQSQQVQNVSEPVAPVRLLPRLPALAGNERTIAALSERTPITLAPQEGGAVQTPPAPQITFAVPGTPVQASAVSVGALLPASAPHDFAALVDRLVEARDTALAVQAPRAVTASLAHADFGEIAIRFEHRGDALSVALSNPDPEFARAVQTVAPTVQAQLGGEGGASSHRNDAQGQAVQGQGAGSSSGHSSQAQSQQRGSGAPARNPTPQTDGGDGRLHRHDGVFA